MLRFTYFLVSCGLLITIGITFEGHALAYVDPGSSLALYQGATSILMGVLYYFRKRLKAMFTRKAQLRELKRSVQ